MKWLTELFRGKSTPKPQTADKVDEHALALAARMKLLPFSKGLKGADELFVPTGDFLTALEMRAGGSALLRLTTQPQTARSAAKYSMQTRIIKGEMPFFFRDQMPRSVFMDDIYVRARDVADHAGKLLGLGQVALASVYAEALEDCVDDMLSHGSLSLKDSYTYCSGNNVGQFFEVGADEDDNRPIQPVLRPRTRSRTPGQP